jgi:uracil-DNA glycosylase
MDGVRRQHYLQALGIQAWIPRGRAAEQGELEAETAPSVAVAAAEVAAADVNVLPDVKTILPAAPAANYADWDALAAAVKDCTRCGLCKTRTQTVFGVGNRAASWMFIGEAPGADEDRQGEPFVGRAGKLLDNMITALGLTREQVYIANVLKCRPPGNRDPEPDEVHQCLPYLARQVEWVKPDLIVALGRIAAQNLLSTTVPLNQLRGKCHTFGAQRTPVVITYHPAYLLRTPAHKGRAWEDLLFAREQMTRKQ